MKGWNAGWDPFGGDGSDLPGASVSFQYVPWKSFQTKKGVYDWSGLETKLTKASPAGKHLVLRVYPQWDGTEPTGLDTQAPGYLFTNMGVRYFFGTNATGNARGSIDYGDTNYLNEAAKMIQALAARYDNDPRIYAIQLGVLGFWGEGHTFGMLTNHVRVLVDPSAKSNILKAYQTSFKNKKLMARQVEEDVYADAGGIGFHNDFFLHLHDHDSNFTQNILNGSFWKNGPIGGEAPPESGNNTYQFYQATAGGGFVGLDMIERGHYATMKQGAYGKSSSDPDYGKYTLLSRRMGYNFRIQEAVFARSNYTGVPLRVSVKGTNIGNAPMYYAWEVEYALLDAASNVVVRATAPVTLTSVMEKDPFQFDASLSVPYSLPGGSYKVGLRIIQPGASSPKAAPWALHPSNVAIQFANTFPLGYIQPAWSSSNSLNGGWSILGNVTLFTNTKLIVSGFPPDMATNQAFSFSAGVSGNTGHIATNRTGPYSPFTVAGTNISVTSTTTYWYFASNAATGSSPTNSNTYIIDLAAPTISGFPPGLTTNAGFSLFISADESHGYFANGLGSGFSVIPSGGTNVQVTNSTTFRYYSKDAAGNSSPTNIVTYHIDNRAPSVNALPAIWGTTNTPFFMSFTTDEDFGYLSTNGASGPWIQYDTRGTNIWISRNGGIQFYGRDAFGNQTSTNTRFVIIDTNGPAITGFLSSRRTNAAFNLSLDVDESYGYFSTNASGPFWVITTNGTNVSVTATQTFWYFGVDKWNNLKPTNQVTYTFDSDPPVFSFTPTNLTTNAAFTLFVDVDENTGYIATNLAGPFLSITTNGTNFSVNKTITYYYYGKDMAGNSNGIRTVTYTVDTNAGLPMAPVVGGFPPDFMTNETFTLAITVNSNFGCISTNAGGPYFRFSTGGTNLSVSETTRFWYFGSNSTGGVGPTNSALYSFDRVAPSVTGFVPDATTNRPFSFRVSVDENLGYFSTNATGPFTSLNTNGTVITVTQPVRYWYFGRDFLGNTSATNQRIYDFDTTPPLVTGFPASFVTNASFSIRASVSEDHGFLSTNASGPYSFFSTNGTNLNVNGSTRFWVYGMDALGNTSSTNVYDYTVDRTPPVLGGMPESLTTNSAFVLNLTVDEDLAFVATNAAGPFHGFRTNGTNITVTGTRSFWFYTRDIWGNQSATNTRTFTFDTVAPMVFGIPGSFSTNQSFTITAGVSADDGWISTNWTGPYARFGVAGTNILVNRSTTVYFYGRDAMGNNSVTNGATYTFDSDPPVVSGFPLDFTTNRSFTFTATVSENTGYLATNRTGPYFSFRTNGTNLAVSESVQFWFFGRDLAGNTSATNSRTYLFDLRAPSITGLPSALATNSAFSIQAQVDENSGYVSTNASGPWSTFSTNGTNLTITSTTTLFYFGRDSLGNTSPTNTCVCVFELPPPVVLGFPRDFSTNAPFSLSIKVDRNSGYLATNVSGPYSVFSTNGTNLWIATNMTFWYFGRDAFTSGPTNRVSYSFDAMAPVLSGMPPSLVTNRSFMASIGINEGQGFIATNLSGPWSSFDSNTGTNLAIDRTMTLYFWGRDPAGNTSSTNARTYTLDMQAPRISGFPASLPTNVPFSFRVTVDENAGYVSTNGTLFQIMTTAGSNIFVSNSVTFWFFARDSLGNTSTTNQIRYTVQTVSATTFSSVSVQNNPYSGNGGGMRFQDLPEKTTVTIYRVSGSPIRKLEVGPDHPSSVHWDLKDQEGRPVGVGVYFAMFSAPGIQESRLIKIMVLQKD